MRMNTSYPHSIFMIGDERVRQIDHEGYDAAHDDTEKPGALTMAAICYATMAASSNAMRNQLRTGLPSGGHWPWDPQYWKPGKMNSNMDRIIELKKAGALIAAEIDRLLRVDEQDYNHVV